MAAHGVGDGNALLKRHAPRFSTAFARAVKSGRVTEAQVSQLEGLEGHVGNPLFPEHLLRIERSFVRTRDVREALRELAELAQLSTLPPVKPKLSGLRIAGTGLATAGLIAAGTTIAATGLAMHLDKKDKRPTLAKALKQVLEAEAAVPGALADLWRKGKSGQKPQPRPLNLAPAVNAYARQPLPATQPDSLSVRLHAGIGDPLVNLAELIDEHLKLLPPKLVAKISGSPGEKLAKLKALFGQRSFHKRVSNESLLLFVQYGYASRHLANANNNELAQQAGELSEILGERYCQRSQGKTDAH